MTNLRLSYFKQKSWVAILAWATAAALPATSLAQNTSLATSPVAKKESALSVDGYMYQSKPVREENDSTSLFGVEIGYKLESNKHVNSSLSVNVETSYVWSEYKDAGETQQIDAVEFGFSRSNALIYKGMRLLYGATVGVPANDADTKAGFQGSLGGSLGISMNLGKQNVVVAAVPTVYNYKYETATEHGDVYNKRFSVLLRARLLSPLTKSLSWRNSASLFDYQNYSGKTFQNYSFSSIMAFSVIEKLTLIAGVTSGDRVITTNSVLADDVTAYRAGLEWSF